MGLLFKISFRNLLRQKRRNFFLGLAIAVSMVILVAVNSFTNGLSDSILNKWLVYEFGHVSVNGYENGKRSQSVIRDQERIIKLIKSVKGVHAVNNYLSSILLVIGNGKSSLMSLVGMPENEGIEYFRNSVQKGDIYDWTNSSIENPVIMSDDKAKELDVRIGDKLKVRLNTINGQVQSANLTLVAMQKTMTSGQGFVFFIPLHLMKEIMGYRPYESGRLQVVLDKMDDPAAAITAANKIHELLKPGIAGYYGDFYSGGYKTKATVLTFYTNSNSMRLIAGNLQISKGSWDMATNSNAIALSEEQAKKLNAGLGSVLTGIYSNKFGGSTTNIYRIGAIFKPGKLLREDVILASENNFYSSYLKNLPEDMANLPDAYMPSDNIITSALGTEWKLLPRTFTSETLAKKLRKALRENFEGSYYDVDSMYEIASFFILFLTILNYISLIFVMILFFVILIGVLNTLRMTIRERTREIGTIRAIGMQKDDVKSSFILETFYLTLFGCGAGIIATIVILFMIDFIPIEASGIFGMFLYNKHINFVLSLGKPAIIFALAVIFIIQVLIIRWDKHIPKWVLSALLVIFVFSGFIICGFGSGILTFLILILNMLMAIAYFPARRAANMPAAAALRQYE
jgi:ABC-type lipoprotein release transport system permease subunit